MERLRDSSCATCVAVLPVTYVGPFWETQLFILRNINVVYNVPLYRVALV